MYQFWQPVIEPMLERLEPRVLVEIGSDQGFNTRNLLNFCRATGATLHAIDPLPKFDVDEWQREYPDTFIFHRKTSLEALQSISDADVVLIDGDHNWHTVFHELKALELLAGEAPFPVVFLHDVGWPYGRRDLYYDPDRIPEPHRHSYRRAGIRPNRRDLDLNGGLNRHLLNAVEEGGPRNGILTAVEDFLQETPLELDFLQVHGIHDLGILTPTELKSQNTSFAESLEELGRDTVLQTLLERVESLRVDSLIEALDQEKSREEAESLVAKLRADLESITNERSLTVAELQEERDRRVTQLEIRLNSIRQERDHLSTQLKRLNGELSSYERTTKQLTDKIERIEADRLRLLGRRAVRLALGLAGLARPFFHMRRRLRSVFSRRRRSEPRRVARSAREAVSPVQSGVSGSDGGAGVADIVVCIHNAEEDVRACLDSIVATTNLVTHTLILVDDGSDESVEEMLRKFADRYPVQLIRNERARGYAIAANQGLAASEHPHVVLLNSDTVVGPEWLEKLIRCAEVMPDVAVVGPYSNAASWQSIPQLTYSDGTWHLNPLPDRVSPDDLAVEVEKWSPRLYPEVPLINGFCYLITRRALDRVGSLDEQSFPMGYGEEDDFSIRCREAGLKLYVADDCYVYHAKSRSHTPEGRRTIVRGNKEVLNRKHGAETIKTLVDHMRYDEELIRSRTYVGAAIERAFVKVPQPDLGDARPLVGWLQPHLGEAGGIRRAIEMTNRLSRWGFRSVLITPDGRKTDWLPVLSDVASIDEARSLEFDSLILSDPDMVWPFLEFSATTRIVYHLAPYMLYRKAGETLEAYYQSPLADVRHVANSKWTAELVQDYANLVVEGVFPGGVDKRLFHPMRIEKSHDVVCHGSKRRHKGTDSIVQACSDLRLLKMEAQDSSQQDLARLLSSGRVYASAAWHEGFNLAALEAMACGIPVVMTNDGGSSEYAVDGENALVVEPHDVDALRSQILRTLENRELRATLIENGIRTAWSYDWDPVTADFAEYVLSQLKVTAK